MKIYSPSITGSFSQSGSSSHFISNVSVNKGQGSTSLEVEGTVSASYFDGDGHLLTNITGSYVEYSNIVNLPYLLSGSAQIASEISGAFTDLSGAFEVRIINQEQFSSSLDATFATDADLTALSSSLEARIINQEQFSASLDATFATDAELTDLSSSFSSSLAFVSSSLSSELYSISGSFSSSLAFVSSSLQGRVDLLEQFSSSIDTIYATDSDVTNLSSSLESRVTANEFVTAKTLLSGSAQIASEISGAFTADSSSFESRISANEVVTAKTLISSSNQLAGTTITGDLTLTGALYAEEIHTTFISASIVYGSGSNIFGSEQNNTHQFTGSISVSGSIEGMISSSAQIASEISGAFGDISSSLESRVAANEFITAKTLISGSAQIATEISGAFTDLSSSFEARIFDNETVIAKTLLSGSAQIASEISGAFTDLSSSFEARISDNEFITAKTLISSSLQFDDLTSPFTGSYTGSFFGDGAGLTNIDTSSINNFGLEVSRSAVYYNIGAGQGFPFVGEGQVTGSLLVSGSAGSYVDFTGVDSISGSIFSGSFTGDGSGLTGVTGAGFPYFGTAIITGSVIVSGSAGDNIDFTQISAVSASIFSGSFYGDGSNLTGISVASLGTANSVTPFSATASITITHSFNTDQPLVQVYDNTNTQILPDSITALDEDTVKVTFATERTGNVIIAKGGDVITQITSFDQNTTTTASFTSESSKTIAHNFDSPNVVVAVYDENNVMFFPQSITLTDSNTVDLVFSGPSTGYAVVSRGGHIISGSVDWSNLYNVPSNIISSSLQFNNLSSPFTGSFTGSFYGDGSNLSGVTSYTDSDTLSYINSVGVLSGSAQIASEISGAFTDVSSSLESRVTNNEIITAKTLISGSDQLAGTTINGDLTLTGILTAQELRTEFISSSIIYSSGSNRFGDLTTDTHQFTGSLYISGSVSLYNGAGIYTFKDSIATSTTQSIFSIENSNGAQAMRLSFVVNSTGFSVAKIYDVVHSSGSLVVYNKAVDTGAFSGRDILPEFSGSDNKITCKVINQSTDTSADLITTLNLGGSSTEMTITTL